MDAEILHHFCVLPTEITLLLKKLRDAEILRLYEFRGTLTFNLQIEPMQKFCMHALFFWLMFNQTKILFTNANLGACKNSASLCVAIICMGYLVKKRMQKFCVSMSSEVHSHSIYK